MKKSLFITGASGFIGRNFIKRIESDKFDTIYCLSRKSRGIAASSLVSANIKAVKGDLLDTAKYSPYLEHVETVIHFAAATGKLKPSEYFQVNSEGTRLLIEQCKKSGVKNLLYISSISVTYQDISRYYYAQSKLKGEKTVIGSGLNYIIIRPTIVIGRDSPIWISLYNLARMPVVPVFGKGAALMQPVYIDDLVDCLLHILSDGLFNNTIFDFGGPETINIEGFLGKIKRARTRGRVRVIHIPLWLIIPFLSFFEEHFYSLLPFNTGQLSAFRFDSTVKNRGSYHVTMKDVDEMVRLSITTEAI